MPYVSMAVAGHVSIELFCCLMVEGNFVPVGLASFTGLDSQAMTAGSCFIQQSSQMSCAALCVTKIIPISQHFYCHSSENYYLQMNKKEDLVKNLV